MIMGRRSYDDSIEEWGGKGPLGDVPCFVVTHRPLENVEDHYSAYAARLRSDADVAGRDHLRSRARAASGGGAPHVDAQCPLQVA